VKNVVAKLNAENTDLMLEAVTGGWINLHKVGSIIIFIIYYILMGAGIA
jgi:hypothetical protein